MQKGLILYMGYYGRYTAAYSISCLLMLSLYIAGIFLHWAAFGVLLVLTLAGVMLLAVAGSILTSLASYPEAVAAELPMVAVATAISPTLGTVYGIVLLLSMFCNALASLVAMLTYMEQKQAVFRKHKKLTLAAAAVLSWIGSLAGFGDLISVIFPVFGYLSVVFLVCMIVHFIQCKRREKQSA